jgi:hypothetical protein
MAVSRFIQKRQEEYRKLYGKVEHEVMQITKDTFVNVYCFNSHFSDCGKLMI